LGASVRPVAEALERRCLLTAALPAVPSWVEQGPGPITGSQPVIPANNNPAVGAVDAIVTVLGAANVNTAFIGTVNGGVWRTTNLLTGATPAPIWTPLTDQMPSLSIGALGLDPLDATNNTLYAAVGRLSSNIGTGGDRVGIYVTTNALSNDLVNNPVVWSSPVQRPEIFQNVDIVSIVPTAQMTANGQVILLATNNGLWRSENGGKNWLNLSHAANVTKLATGLPAGAAVSDLVADPTNNGRFFAAIPKQGVYVNVDNTGLKWKLVNNSATLNAGNSARIRLAMHSTGVLYVAVIDPVPGAAAPKSKLTAVFRTPDQGTTWTNLGAPNPTVNNGNQGFIHLSLAADPDPANSNVVYVGGDSQAASPFPGNLARYSPATGWTSIVSANANGTAPHADSRVLAFAGDKSLLEGDDGGIYRLVNPGNVAGSGTRQWQGLDNNLRATEFYSVAYDPNFNIIIGGAQDNGLSQQTAQGSPSWASTGTGDGTIVDVDTTTAANTSVRYSSLLSLGFFRRTTVTAAGSAAANVALNVGGTGVTLLAGDPNVRQIQPWELGAVSLPAGGGCNAGRPMLIATALFFYESCDYGDTLTQTALPALPALPANRSESFITAMAYGGANQPTTGPNSALIYVTEDIVKTGTNQVVGTRLVRREVAGGLLTAANIASMTGYTGGSVVDIVVDPNNWHTLFLINKNSVWESKDKGQSFINLTNNLHRLTTDLRTIEFVDPNPAVAGDEVLLVGGAGGVFRRSPVLNSKWTEFGAGLANALVRDLHYDSTANLLLAGTFGRGAWTLPNVRAAINQKAVLNVTGTAATETITLVRNANNPLLLDVVVQPKNPGPSEITTFQLSTIDQISVKGGGGSDNLVIDESQGPINAVIPQGITWDGAAATRSTLSKTTNIPASSVAALEGGMQSTADLTNAVASNTATGTELPFVDESIGDVLTGTAAAAAGKNAAAALPGAADIGSILKTGLLDAVTNYFGVDSTPTVEELVGVLQGLSRNVGDLSFNVDPSTVFGGIFSTEDHDELKFDLVFQASRTVHNIPIKLGVAADSLGLHLDASAKVDLTASMTFDFSFGVILDPNLDPRDAFFIQPHSLSFNGSVHASPANFGVTVGFLKAGVQNGTIDLNGSISVHFKGFEEPQPLRDSFAGEDDFNSAPLPGDPNTGEAPDVQEHLLTQSDLQGTSVGDLISDVTVSGSLDAKLPIVASLGGVVIPGAATITVTDSDLFDGNLPQISTDADFDKLLDFDNVTPATILGLVDQFGNFLEQFRGSSVFATPVPFTNKTLGDLLDMRKAFLDKVGSVLEPQPGQASFSTAQDLADKLSSALGLPPSAIAAKYDPATHDLTYHVKLSDSLPAVLVPIAFNVDLGSLGGINTSSTLSLSANAGLEFTLGINLAAPKAVITAGADASSNGKLSAAAHLSIQVGSDDPVNVTIAADATNTKIDDLISDINAALAAAGLGSTVIAGKSGNKITLSTKGLFTPAALMITATANDPVVTDLHFATSQGATNTLAHQFFIKDASVNGSVTLNASDIDASARFGFLDVAVVNGHGTGTASITAGLKDPGTVAADGKITLDELFGAVSKDVTTMTSSPMITGSANLVLPIQVTPNILGASAPANPTITINWTDITDPSTLSPSFNGDMDRLLDFQHLSYLDIINALLSSVDYLSQLQQFSFLNQKLPLINKSVSELADSAQDLSQKIQQAEQNPAASLQTIAGKLEQAMGLPAGSIKLTLDGKAVRLDLALQTGFQQNLAINLDLATLASQAGGISGLQGVGDLIDVAGSAKLSVAADAKLNLALGVDLTDPISPKPFLYDSTAVALDAKASGSNLSFTASLGPLGLFIENGTANLDLNQAYSPRPPGNFV
jgi:hypothetical protein